MLYKSIHTIRQFTKRLRQDDIGAYSAQAAFFIILSAFPFFMLLLTLIKYTPLTEDTLFTFISGVLPPSLSNLSRYIIQQLYTRSSITLISVTAIITIWSSGKGILAIIQGMNSVHHIKEQRNYIFLRIISAFYTVLLILAILVSLGLLVFGNHIYRLLALHAPLVYEFVGIFIRQKIIISLLLLVLFFICIYKIVPDQKYSMTNNLPGAVFSAVSWTVFSYGFSIYIDNFSNLSIMYGSISALMLIMLWLYICMYLLFIGAEINVFFKQNIEIFYKKISERYHKL